MRRSLVSSGADQLGAGRDHGRALLAGAAATHYYRDWILPVDGYLGLLGTTSQYAVAAPTVRGRLFETLGRVLGDPARLDGRTLLLSSRSS